MKYKWLNNNKNSKLIIFFNGWGMDENIVKHLNPTEFDILMFYDYNSLSTDFDFKILENYIHKYLISWSMGVMVATLFNIDYKKKIAINGTLKPINNEFGIPERIYELTLKNFNENGIKKFISNMFLDSSETVEVCRDFENQKTELAALKNYKSNMNFKYDKVFISKYDKIIPTKNQIAYWGIEPNIESGHAPFKLFKSWEEIL